MLKGDIANESVARLVIVFETLIVSFTDTSRAKFDKAAARGQWEKALKNVQINELIVKYLYDLTFRLGYNIDVVTYIDPEFAEALEKFCEDEELPVSRVFFSTPERMARTISNRPDIAAVFDGNAGHIFTYGAKGRIVNPNAPEFL